MVVERPSAERWDWIVLELETDPVFAAATLGIPRHARKRIAAVAEAGVDFDRLYLAHEVPKIALLPPGTIDVKGWEHELVLRTARSGVERAAQRLDTALDKLGRAGRSAADVGPSALGSLFAVASDPVLMGAIRIGDDQHTQTLAMFEIARWIL